MSQESILYAPMQATVAAIEVDPGEAVDAGDEVLVLEAMKMEHVLEAEASGNIARILVEVGDLVQEGDALLALTPSHAPSPTVQTQTRDLPAERRP